MLRRTWSTCAILALLFGGTAAAQQTGTLEVGGFGQYTWFDDHAGRCTTGDPCLDAVAKDGFGYGGRIGWRVYDEALARGAYLRPLGDTVSVTPPLNIPDAELEQLLAVLHDSIAAAHRG